MYIKYYTIAGMQMQTPESVLWNHMKSRCNPNGYFQKQKPSYIGCTMSENFEDFQYFAEWCNKQFGFNKKDNNGNLYRLDKDILNKGNKVYSENACVFVPTALNSLLISCKRARGKYPVGVHYSKCAQAYVAQISYDCVRAHLGKFSSPQMAFIAYKSAKDAFVKQKADEYRGLVDNRVIVAMLNYEVEITD
jgi:hypothetical protein